ncbi:TPA: hypothetical protein DD445_02730 [Candidatus Nomurabacteria bacterium]|nr:hypothetical protein [Candidatus Nomurabacteria bacterium]HBP27678.1 hypothetical protein [Candidatus Nomurabacteria bacterium]HBR66065.1 hypothetical protein [Candidatus Nomurabacteria bacterium]HCU47358.1 hypothetical protein [Candidatus Nomurabacteria bacterium]
MNSDPCGFLPRPLLRTGISLGRANPKPREYCFALPSPFIRFVLLDSARNSFELCPIDTANVRDSKQKQKMGRHEVPTLMNSRQETLNPKGFAKENWAHRLLIQKYE